MFLDQTIVIVTRVQQLENDVFSGRLISERNVLQLTNLQQKVFQF